MICTTFRTVSMAQRSVISGEIHRIVLQATSLLRQRLQKAGPLKELISGIAFLRSFAMFALQFRVRRED